MHTVRWVASRVVDRAISNIRLRVSKPQNYDAVSVALYAKHNEGGAALVHDQMLFNDAVRHAEVDDMLDALAKIAHKNSKQSLIQEIDSACDVLSNNCETAIKSVTSRLTGSDRVLYALEMRRMTDEGLDIYAFLKLQWESAVRRLEQKSSLRGLDYSLDQDIISRTKIKHVTDLGCAFKIVTERFLVNRSTISGDHCANFCAEDVDPCDAERTGCTLYFSWSGPVIQNKGLSTDNMSPSTLYAQDAWRYALRPGTTEGLTFNEISFQAPIGKGEAPLVAGLLNSRRKSISVEWR